MTIIPGYNDSLENIEATIRFICEELDPSVKVEFMPGGLHIMLIGLKQDLNAGDEVEVTLQFTNSPDLTVKAIVKDPDGTDMSGMDHSE